MSSVASLTESNTGSVGPIGREGATYLPSARGDAGFTYDTQSRSFFVFGGIAPDTSPNGLLYGWSGESHLYECIG